MFVPLMRLDHPFDDNGRGWRKLSQEEIAALAYVAIRLVSKAIRTRLAGRIAADADEAARRIAQAVAQRLAAYPIFGPAKPAGNHSARCRTEGDPPD